MLVKALYKSKRKKHNGTYSMMGQRPPSGRKKNTRYQISAKDVNLQRGYVMRMCLASKPRAYVFRQKIFKACVQRERRIQGSDQHIYCLRCLHLHEEDIYIKKKTTTIYSASGTTWNLCNRYAIHCHQMFKHAEFNRKD